jgi:hypothetical protein
MMKRLTVPFCYYFTKMELFRRALDEPAKIVVLHYFETFENMPHPARFCILPAYETGPQFEPVVIEPAYNALIKNYEPHNIGLTFNLLYQKIALQALPPEGAERKNYSREHRIGFSFIFSEFENGDGDDKLKPLPTFPTNERQPEKALKDHSKITELSF